MSGLLLALGGAIAVTLGLSMFAIPSDTADTLSSAAKSTGLPTGLYNPRAVRFTAVIVIIAGVVFVLIGLGMAIDGR